MDFNADEIDFLRSIWDRGGSAKLNELPPVWSRSEDRARQRLKRRGFVDYSQFYRSWRLTDIGRDAAAGMWSEESKNETDC